MSPYTDLSLSLSLSLSLFSGSGAPEVPYVLLTGLRSCAYHFHLVLVQKFAARNFCSKTPYLFPNIEDRCLMSYAGSQSSHRDLPSSRPEAEVQNLQRRWAWVGNG